MVRAYWIGPLLVALAVTGLALSQTSTPAVVNPPGSPKERIVTVGDLGKPGQKCRVLKTWTMPNGHPAYQVQALDTGELITIEESASAASPARFGLFHAHETRIFHWGGDGKWRRTAVRSRRRTRSSLRSRSPFIPKRPLRRSTASIPQSRRRSRSPFIPKRSLRL